MSGRIVSISIEEWRDPDVDLLAIDRRVHEAEIDGARFTLRIAWTTDRDDTAISQILTRYQRLRLVRNDASSGGLFDRVLDRYRAMHPLEKPLVRADWDHALDTWQWLLRIEPNADLTVQLGALLHDIERLAPKTDRRVEHLAADYQAFKDLHAESGAPMVRDLLRSAGAEPKLVDRTAAMIARHERKSDAPSLRLLNDADALSFFSLSSAGFLAYFGPLHTTKIVRYTLERMSSRAKQRLSEIRMPRAIAEQLQTA